jgi:DNA-binding response OmpR family regulator
MCAVFGKKVLIADDNDFIRESLVDFFSFNGYEAFTARDGGEALGIIEEKYFSILVTDLNMPVINGIELIRAVRDLNMSVTIIGMSGEDNKSVFLKAGADYFLSKPFDFRLLESILDSIIQE